jgi:SAM-dependent methyltransferase
MSFGVLIVLICEALLLLLAVYLIFSWFTQTPFYPSSVRKLSRLIDNKTIKVPESGKFIDIGSGDGRFVIWAAKRGYQSDGIEFNPFLTLLSKFKIFIHRLSSKATVFNKNFNDHSFADYSIAYLYIFSEHMDKLKHKLFNEMKPGSVIITNTFKFTNVEPDEQIDRFYIYYVK